MSKRILLTCNQVPYYGGASTTFYILFKMLQRRGMDVHYLNLIDKTNLGLYSRIFNHDMGNPCNIINVHNMIYDDSVPAGLSGFLDSVEPDIILAKNFTAPYLIGKVRPDIEMWHFPSACNQIRNAIYKNIISSELDAWEIIKEPGSSIPITWEPESIAVEYSEKIISNSRSTLLWFKYFYPESESRLYNEVL